MAQLKLIRHKRNQGGFTLIEVLVVVLIMGIVASLALLSGGLAGPTAKVSEEARRLAQLITLQCNEAVLSGREGGVRLESTGYAFSWWNGEGWEPRLARVFRDRLLPDPVVLELEPGHTPALGNDGPQLICWSSGEMTPFDLALYSGDGPRYQLRGQTDGTIELLGWQGEDAG